MSYQGLRSFAEPSHLESLTDGLYRSPRPLRCHWLSRYCIIYIGGDMELQQLRKLANNVLWGAIFLLSPQLYICLYDLGQLVSQVILTPAAMTRRQNQIRVNK